MNDETTLRQYLADAEAALHQLATGAKVAAIRDASGRQVNYGPAEMAGLRAYIAELRAKLGQGGRARAARVYFG